MRRVPALLPEVGRASGIERVDNCEPLRRHGYPKLFTSEILGARVEETDMDIVSCVMHHASSRRTLAELAVR
eukprot:9497813-Pyramimonas_sp.AAC.1